ncbi:MAG: hypothetical protein MUC76_02750 [Spirochaetes bacterium]|jgi:hypothetical protein|nr:hypothetical protein [Spirochaetota bacterium]
MIKRLMALCIIAAIIQITNLTAADKLQPAMFLGTWRLLYKGNYGYTFRFHKNYRSVCVIHLNTSAVVFKGIYAIEDDKTIRINIYEMKNDCNARMPSTGAGFTKTSSTYFIFRAVFSGAKNAPVLILSPSRTVIDGRSSEGYFEPEIRLSRAP